MKLGPDMYHLNTFNVPKDEGVNERAVGEGGHPKNHQKMP